MFYNSIILIHLIIRFHLLNNLQSVIFIMNPTIDWNDVIKKEARSINDEDLGKVQQVEDN